MKTQILKNNRVLVLCIYALAFVLMTWSFSARAEDVKPAAKKSAAAKSADKKSVDIGLTTKASTTKPSDANPTVVITTNLGKIVVKLNSDKAPLSTENFMKYVDKKQYDGTIFHRVIKDFMVQGGGFTADMKEKETLSPIKNEANNGLSNKRGTISMARTNDVNSATAQFFINTVDNERLDYKSDASYGYAVFGEVTEGLAVVDKIREVKTTTKSGMEDVPVEPVTITSIRRGTK